MPKRHNHKGRSTTERFVSLPRHMLRSAAWRSLSPVARCIFLELAAIYNGGNNGFIALSTRDAARHVCCSKDTAARALTELMDKGFIVCCSRGHFDRKSPHASEYRLTLHSCNRTSEKAPKAFMRWQPGEAKSVAGPMAGTAGLITGTVTALTKENYRLRSDEKDRQPSFEPSSGPTTGTHIIYQMGAGVEEAREPSAVVVKLQPGGRRHAS
ncbi:helix-turn-helix domain-containing protein [Microvirga sp. BSC39]|uniref:helix-turn-helix domain-containing protein n=1 Tax=Microvirga sp. BSC39 TaxID=1549810 RepID=UPI0013643E39|nr:helix-turn-helix domain-containing protein [Microvirga sp. BSC39]